jgi:DNA recombination protein RmuC
MLEISGLVILAFIATISIGTYCVYRVANLRMQLVFSISEKSKIEEKMQILEALQIDYIKNIQSLESENKYLKLTISDSEKLHKEAFSAAKSSLFELGGNLSKQLIDLHKQENKEAREISEQKINVTAQKFHTEFERIVKMIASLNQEVGNSKSTVDIIKQSLLSPSGAGQLAEITLENILKSSGLKPNIDFMIQYTVNVGNDQKLRPDAVVFLPGNNVMVIDAKASKFLVDFAVEKDEANASKLLKIMNSHLKSLASKDYIDNLVTSYNLSEKSVNHVMMLMFLPTEYAVDKITNIDHEFISRAWGLNIFPVGPSGLMNMLSFARFQIHDNVRTSNHKVIVEEIRKIIGSISVLAEYSHKIGNSVQSLVNNYDKFSASFNRTFLPKVRVIQQLGIDTNNKTKISSLTRYHLVSSKSELIDVDSMITDEIEEE